MDQQEIIKFSLVFFKYLITAKCKKQSIKLISDLMGRRKVLRALKFPPPEAWNDNIRIINTLPKNLLFNRGMPQGRITKEFPVPGIPQRSYFALLSPWIACDHYWIMYQSTGGENNSRGKPWLVLSFCQGWAQHLLNGWILLHDYILLVS